MRHERQMTLSLSPTREQFTTKGNLNLDLFSTRRKALEFLKEMKILDCAQQFWNLCDKPKQQRNPLWSNKGFVRVNLDLKRFRKIACEMKLPGFALQISK